MVSWEISCSVRKRRDCYAEISRVDLETNFDLVHSEFYVIPRSLRKFGYRCLR